MDTSIDLSKLACPRCGDKVFVPSLTYPEGWVMCKDMGHWVGHYSECVTQHPMNTDVEYPTLKTRTIIAEILMEANMEPKIGDTVLYVLNQKDADYINQVRNYHKIAGHTVAPVGSQAHIGNHASAGETFPMTIVAVWPKEFGDKPGVNGQVLLDGNDSLWVTSAKEGHEWGQWRTHPVSE